MDKEVIERMVVEGQRYKIYLKNQFCYSGTLLLIDKEFLKLFDEKTGEKVILPMSEVTTLVEVEK